MRPAQAAGPPGIAAAPAAVLTLSAFAQQPNQPGIPAHAIYQEFKNQMGEDHRGDAAGERTPLPRTIPEVAALGTDVRAFNRRFEH